MVCVVTGQAYPTRQFVEISDVLLIEETRIRVSTTRLMRAVMLAWLLAVCAACPAGCPGILLLDEDGQHTKSKCTYRAFGIFWLANVKDKEPISQGRIEGSQNE